MKQVKKAKWISLFLFRLIVVTVVVILFCAGVTFVRKEQYDNEKTWESQSGMEFLRTNIYEKYTQLQLEGKKEDVLKDELKDYLQWQTAVLATNEPSYIETDETTAISIYNRDTKELYAISDKTAYITLTDFQGMDGLYRYEGTHMDEFERLNDKLDELVEAEYRKEFPFSNLRYDFAVDGIYLSKNNTFTPKNISLVKYQYNAHEWEESETILTYNMEPENASDYTYIPVERSADETCGILLFGFGSGTNKTGNAHEKLVELLEGKSDLADTGLDEILESDTYTWGWYDNNNETLIEASQVDVGDMKLEIIYAHTYDFWTGCKYHLTIIYIGIGICGLLTVLVWTIYSYKMKKGYFELDQYRKYTTNTLAHDLKTPLTAILGYTENLQNKTHPEKNDYYLQSIHSNVNYMNGLIEKVLALGKVEESGYELRKEELTVTDLIHEVEEKYEFLMGERDLQVEVTGNATLISDRILLAQILDNLIGNAVKYGLAGTVIHIVLSQEKITVTNLMENALEQSPDELLKPFIKGNDSRGGITGSGLGLTIVSNIVKLLKYKLSISTNENEFTVTIQF